MSSSPPFWLKAVIGLERAIAPHATRAVASADLASALTAVNRLRGGIASQGEHATRRVLHLLNLPAGSDVTRVLTEIGRLQNQVLELSVEVARARENDPS